MKTVNIIELCPYQKCGEYNMLRCYREKGHSGECCFAVDHENDYPSIKPRTVIKGEIVDERSGE